MQYVDCFRYKGILLYGPPGTGKTSLASSCAYDAEVNLFTINGPEIISHYYGESEQSLYDVFSSAKQAAPAVVRISLNNRLQLPLPLCQLQKESWAPSSSSVTS